MRCPSCNIAHPEGARACEACGLLFAPAEPLKRRQEDREIPRRRATDRAQRTCPFCHAGIDIDAVRCRHCSQIVDENFRRAQMIRRRNHVNYASWVFYIFGLVVFVIFRPVGIISIGIGILLSIVYYAIPVEPLPSKSKISLRRIFATMRKQLSLERVGVSVPHLPKRRMFFVGTPLLAAVLGYFVNFVLLQMPMNRILEGNSAFSGIEVTTHYHYWVVPGVVVYDLTKIDATQSPLQVHGAFLEYAKEMKNRRFRRVELRYRGEDRISIDGANFRKLGEEYALNNYRYALFEFPTTVTLRRTGNERITSSGAEALAQFFRHWYLDDVAGDRSSTQERGVRRPARSSSSVTAGTVVNWTAAIPSDLAATTFSIRSSSTTHSSAAAPSISITA
jgi:hypothetical protein